MKKVNTYIIPVLNNYKGLEQLLLTLKAHTPDNYYVFVVDNGYSIEQQPEDVEIRNRCQTMVDIWINPVKNLGFGKAMNQGLKLATTEFVTLSNDDVEIMYDGWWDELMQLFKEDPTLGGWNPHSPCNKSCSGDRVIQYDHKDNYTLEDIEKMKEVFHAEREYTGCCTFFTICRKKMFDDIGLFDESFGLGSGEDYDLCVRAARSGWRIKGGSKVMVWHWWGNTKDNMPKGIGISNYNLIAGGNQNMERKWGPHIDKVEGGWSVSGSGGPEKPFDSDKVDYQDGKYYQEVEL